MYHYIKIIAINPFNCLCLPKQYIWQFEVKIMWCMYTGMYMCIRFEIIQLISNTPEIFLY